MKKMIVSVTFVVALLVMSACSAGQAKKETKESQAVQITATITISQNGKETTSQTVTFQKGQNLMAVLKANFKVKDEKGMISEVEGVSQDKAKGYYWTYKINGKMVETGAKDTILKDKDKVVLAYEKF